MGALSHAEQVFAGVWQLAAEINNGGFDRFYSNSAGDLAVETVKALEEIAAPTAEIVRRPDALFDSAKPLPKMRRPRGLDSKHLGSSPRTGTITPRTHRKA